MTNDLKQAVKGIEGRDWLKYAGFVLALILHYGAVREEAATTKAELSALVDKVQYQIDTQAGRDGRQDGRIARLEGKHP